MKKRKENTKQHTKPHVKPQAGAQAKKSTAGRQPDNAAGNKTDNPAEPQKIRDINSREVFGNATLCAQFLRDNLDIPLLKDVQPEDIENVTELYQPFIGVEFESDTVNRIRIPAWSREGLNLPLYLISIVEHKSRVDYNVAMQILRYMVCIWYEYRREMEEKYPGCSQRKSFRYPPILPVVYYEGKANWTADMHLKDRITDSELFEQYIPDFKYKLVRLHDYSNEELLERGDEISLIMMINKIQSAEEFHDFFTHSPEKLGDMIGDSPEHVKEVIQNLLYGLMTKMNVPEKEKNAYVKRIGDRGMGYFFENMEPMDIQAERRNTAEARKQVEEERQQKEEALNALAETQNLLQELMTRMNLPDEEKNAYIKRIGDKGMGYFFENMEPMDIQAERRNTAEARKQAEEERQQKEEALNALTETQNLLQELMTRMNLPDEEKNAYIKRIGDKGMGYFFENMEPMDIQAERRNTAEARKQAEEALNALAETQNLLQELMTRMNLPDEEKNAYIKRIGDKGMGYFFENMEPMDIQAERRNTAEERRLKEAALKELAETKKQLQQLEEQLKIR